MQLPQLRIDQQFAKIGITMQDAKVTMQHQPAELSIQQPQADVNIDTRPGKLSIDQSQAFHDLGQYPVKEAVRLDAQEGKQKVAEGTRRRRQEGDRLMKIEHGGNPIAQIAKEKMPRPLRPFVMSVIPSYNAVKIDYQPSEVSINNQANKPVINAETRPVERQVTPSQFDIYLEQQNNITIDFDNVKYVGPQYELSI